MSDLLRIVVPTFPLADHPDPTRRTGRKYPSVNSLGGNSHRGGRKTPEYRALFAAIKHAAEEEMERVGWTTADYYVEVIHKRYVVTRRKNDAMNGLKTELDALQSAGVFLDDSLVIPRPDIVQYDPRPGAIDRICMAVFRLNVPILAADMVHASASAARAKPPARKQPDGAISRDDRQPYRVGDPIPQGSVLLDGRLVKMDRGELMGKIFPRR